MRSPWIKTNLTGPVKWSTSTLTVLHMNLGYMLCFMDFSMFFILLFVARFLVFHKSLTRKSKRSWYNTIFYRHQLLIYAALQKTSNCDSYLRNARILKFSRKDIIWCSYKKITFNNLYRLILGYNVWWNWLDFNFRFISLFCLFFTWKRRRGRLVPNIKDYNVPSKKTF